MTKTPSSVPKKLTLPQVQVRVQRLWPGPVQLPERMPEPDPGRMPGLRRLR